MSEGTHISRSELTYKLTTWDARATNFIEISETEFYEIRTAKSNLIEAMLIEERMDAVIENYLEFETDLLTSAARQTVERNRSYLLGQRERNLFSRRLANLLSSCRAYLDETCHRLSGMFGTESVIFQLNEDSKHTQYDSCLGYRSMESLRDYSQHRGGLHGISFGMKTVETSDGRKLMFSVAPLLHVNELSSDEKFKPKVLAEFKNLQNEIDVRPFLRDYIGCLSKVHEALRDNLQSKVRDWDKSFLDAIARFCGAYPEVASRSDNQILLTDEIEDTWLFKDFIEYRRYLEDKNKDLPNLSRRFVSNEVVDRH